MCYAAILPLLVYGLLLAFDLMGRTDASVAVLMLSEAVAVFITVRALARRYRSRR
jgi:ABC-type sulfate transport system permease component